MSRGHARQAPAIERLESRVRALLASHDRVSARLAASEREVSRLREEVARYRRERAALRSRLDEALAEVDAVTAAVAGGA
jgi:hypothetical protein